MVRRGAWRSLLASVLAAVAVVVGVVVFVVGEVVHDEVLRADLYADALSERQVYRRLYSEVLTDPAVRDLTDRLLGDLNLAPQQRRDVIAVSNAVLRLALPPDVVDDLVRQILRQVFAYVRGDVARLELQVSVLDAIERTDEAGAVVARRALAAASSLVLDNLDAYALAAQAFADELLAGRVPSSIPVVGGSTVTEQQIIDALDAATRRGLPKAVRDQVVAALQSGDDRDALIAAGTVALRTRLRSFTARLEAGEDLELDLLSAIGLAAPSARDEVVEQLDQVRAVVRWIPSWSRNLGVLIAVAGGVALIVLHRRRLELGLTAVGGALVVGGTTAWLVWEFHRDRLESPLRAMTGGRMPASVRRLVLEVNDTVIDSIRQSVGTDSARVWWLGAALVVAGAVVGVLTTVGRVELRSLLAAASVAVLAAVGFTSVRPSEDRPPLAQACNGHPELCDRRYDEVVQAAAHNAMSSPDVVRVWPEHDAGITAQLDFGIRTLMIDVSYWTGIDTARELADPDTPLPAGLAGALFDTLGERLEARPGTYACHSVCALGGRLLADVLRDVRQFLEANPDEVVTLILQDATAVSDTEQAFVEAGLDRAVFDGDTTDGWPTLRELIQRDQRLVVFSEQHGPPPRWLRTAFETIQDTPHRVRDPDEFSCRHDRGPADAPLFLLNHWVRRGAPDRADALVVNSRSFIVERALECAELRGTLPNFIAVDFFSIGDVLGAVDSLNGVSS